LHPPSVAQLRGKFPTLIEAYQPHAGTAAFATGADKFRNYASAWRDRWNSVMELFMAGGNCSAADAEIAAAK
jgi:hypothetical protein